MNHGRALDNILKSLPLDDPRCLKAAENCTAFEVGMNQSQATTPRAVHFCYGHYTTYYWVVSVGILAIFHAVQLYEDRKPVVRPDTTTTPSVIQKFKALFRRIWRCCAFHY